jgi:TRAP-type C4-dicarboxylate transport system permease small subunit
MILGGIAVLVMLVVIGEDVVARGGFNTSLEISDEIGGYMLVAVAFFALAAAKTRNAFQRTDYLPNMLPPGVRRVLLIGFDLLALGVALLLLWQFWRYTGTRFRSGSLAPTRLATPQWMPAVPMVLGMAAYIFAVLKSILRQLRGTTTAVTKLDLE